MAQINLKKKQRCRVQISISQIVWQKYDANLKLAQSLGAEIDYTKEFEVWFLRQNEQVHQELKRMLAEQGKTVAAVKTVEGGDRHGND